MSEQHQSAASPLAIAAIASAGAAVVHATAAGIHAEHTALTRLFIMLAVAQAAVAVAALLRTTRWVVAALLAVNGFAALGWLVTRLTGISWISGLEVAERPQLADTSAAILAIVAVVATAAWMAGRSPVLAGRSLTVAAVLATVLVIPGLADTTSRDYLGDDNAAAGATDDDHDHTDEPAPNGGATPVQAVSTGNAEADHDDHTETDHDDHTETDHDDHTEDPDQADHTEDPDQADQAEASATAWPRPWDPNGPIDFSGVSGVSDEQRARAEQLVGDTLRDLPAFADVNAVPALGFRSIGDASTGVEHFINADFIADDKFLDPTAPESLVYAVDGDERTLVSAMFIAKETPIDDPNLLDFAGPLMQWHVHLNLCWGLDDNGTPVVRSVLENPGDVCPTGTVNAGGQNPMVHVWIAPHQCGPFAALEGHGAGQADVGEGARTDQCDDDGHDQETDEHAGHAEQAASKPYDPALPIDLGGIDGVTLQQQAFAENLVGATVRDLPQWADLDAVDAAGFHSIGDAATGHEHYIQWDWIDDDVWLDPDYPESLVFEPQPDGSKQLVSAMFMLPSGYPIDEVPDWGGDLMQWHVHGDLCFTDDPVAPQVAGLKPIGGSCTPPLVDGTMAPMIHVWIRSHECGPFAALDGIGGGQVPDGEEVLCDTAHGAH